MASEYRHSENSEFGGDESLAATILDALLARQIESWQAGDLAPVEQLACAVDFRHLKHELVAELVLSEIVLRRAGGEKPTLGEYQSRFPGLSHHIDELFHASEQIEEKIETRSIPKNEFSTHFREVVQQGRTSVASSRAEHLPTIDINDNESGRNGDTRADRKGSPAASSQIFGNYELVEKLGEGGMGVVYKARQINAGNRLAALKLIRPDKLRHRGFGSNNVALARFQKEARATANLQSDYITTVYDVGEIEGQPFYSMQFVNGKSLAEHLKEGPLSNEDAAKYARQIAMALTAAHGAGVLHRDLKPHNVMIDDETDRALLTDFGLAKIVDEDSELTMMDHQDVFGTPAYMSPEQTRHSGKVDESTDIYALGATLYHLLTGRPPFQAARIKEVFRQVEEHDPTPPTQLNPDVWRDLETISLKCLEKTPDRRYRTAADVADRLERVLRGEPIPERPISRIQRVWRWCGRNPVVASLACGLLFVLVAGIVATSAFAVQSETNRGIAAGRASELKAANDDLKRQRGELQTAAVTLQRRSEELAESNTALREKTAQLEQEVIRANREERLARHRSYRIQIKAAYFEWQHGSVDLAWRHLESTPEDVRGWEFKYLKSLFTENQTTLHKRTIGGSNVDVAFSQDGNWFAGGVGRFIRVWKVGSTKYSTEIARKFPKGHDGVTFSPNSELIVSASGDEVTIWKRKTGEQVREFRAKTFVTDIAYSPNGRRILTSGVAGQISNGSLDQMENLSADPRVWDAQSGEELLHIRPKPPTAHHTTDACFNSTGTQVAFAFGSFGRSETNASNRVEVWDCESGKELFSIDEPARGVLFSPDDSRIVSWFSDDIKVWEASKGKAVMTLKGNGSAVTCVAFCPDGQHLVSGGDNGEISLWDIRSGSKLKVLKGHRDSVADIAVSTDGDLLLSGARNASLKLWSLRPYVNPQWKLPSFAAGSVALSGDGEMFATSDATSVVLWNIVQRQATNLDRIRFHRHGCNVAFSPDSKRVACSTYSKLKGGFGGPVLGVWDTSTGELVHSLAGHEMEISCVAFSPGGEKLVTGSEDRCLRVWDAKSGECLRTYSEHKNNINSVAIGPEGKRVASGSLDNTIRIWDIESGETLLVLKNVAPRLNSLDFNEDGTKVMSLLWDHTIGIWDAESGEEIMKFQGHTAPVEGVMFLDGWNRIISGSRDGTVRVWDVEFGEQVLVLNENEVPMTSLCVDKSGRRIVTAWADKSLDIINIDDVMK